jgi:hypothetical protein
MSEIVLDPNIEPPTEKKEQLDFFFSQFTIFLNNFKDIYKLKKISNEINQLYDLIKIFIKDFRPSLSQNEKISSSKMKTFISKNYKGLNNDSMNEFIEPKLISYDKTYCNQKEKINTTYSKIARMVGNAERERDLLLAENTIPTIPSFHKRTSKINLQQLKKCIKE